MDIKKRIKNEAVFNSLLSENIPAMLAHIIASRVSGNPKSFDADDIFSPAISKIAPPTLFADIHCATDRVVDAVKNKETIAIISDYDCDGITSHAIIFEAVTKFFGINKKLVQSYIGNRITDGYGLTKNIAGSILRAKKLPGVAITADCGISDDETIHELKTAGIDVIITDHHAIPRTGIPTSAYAVINPQRKDCPYPDKDIAGCMVAWLFMHYINRCLVDAGIAGGISFPISSLLDFAALGTVSDAVSLLSKTNRAVVVKGLEIINRFDRPCWKAIKQLLSKNGDGFNSQDLGFQVAPRINARSRMSDPVAALDFLLSGNIPEADNHLHILDTDNQNRKTIESKMLAIAIDHLDNTLDPEAKSIVIGSNDFHIGVQGIVASRLVDKYGLPAIVLSPVQGKKDLLSGSARTVGDIHLFNALQYVETKYPDVLIQYGGHKAAAGMKLHKSKVPLFRKAFDEAVNNQVEADAVLSPVLFVDGHLKPKNITIDTAKELTKLEPFGQGFEEPVFIGEFKVLSVKTIGADKTHLSLKLLDSQGSEHKGVWFRALESPEDALPVKDDDMIKCAYRLSVNSFMGVNSVQLIVSCCF